jgi:beta-xylosidase
MRDPHVLQGPDGTFHMVWTTGWTSNGLGYANSKDLIQWSPQQLIQVMDQEPTTRNVWAPELFYLAYKKAFLLFWASTIPGRFSETAESGDKGYNHRIYATTTTDFKSFSPTRLFYDNGFNVIDATIVQGDDRFLMFLKDETRNPPKKNLRIATSSKADGPFGPSSVPITGNYWAEGPTAIKLGNTWHVYFDRYVEHRYGLITSTDLKSWTDESDKVKFPKDHRHGTVFKVTSKVFQALREL